jgi:hypothetical protein
MPFVGSRWGRAVRLNGTDEYLHRSDGSILPAGEFDLDFTATAGGCTFGMLCRRATLALDLQQVLIAKRNDADAGLDAGWLLEWTQDNTIRLLLDDGTNQVEVETTDTFPDDDFWHPIIVRIDYVAATAEIWCTASKDPADIKLWATGSTSTLGDTDNAHQFTIGAVWNGTTLDQPAAVSVDWAGWWNEVLPDEYLRGPITRFQLTDPYDRRVVSFWHFTNQDAADWNRVNANDLTATGITASNYVLGQERFLEMANYQMQPNLADKGSGLAIGTKFFRPHILQEGHFRMLGLDPWPTLRLIESTEGAVDEPSFTAGFSEVPSIVGKYAITSDGKAGGSDFRIYALPVDPDDALGVDAWEPLGSITGDPDYDLIGFFDGDFQGTPQYLFHFTTGTKKLVVTNIIDPTSPSKAGTDATWGPSGSPKMALYDARLNDYVWSVTTSGNVGSFDVSTRSTPALDGTVGNAALTGEGQFVQIGARLYCACDLGLSVVNISNPSAPTFVKRVQPQDFFPESFTEDLHGIVILGSGNILTCSRVATGVGSNWAFHVWDVATDPDDPQLLNRQVVPHVSDDGTFTRLNRHGNLVMFYNSLGANHAFVALSVNDEQNLGIVAYWLTQDLIAGGSGAQGDGVFGRGYFLVTGNALGTGGGFFLFDASQGEGFSAEVVDFNVTGATVLNPLPKYELASLYHDLSAFDFEDDAVATDPPTGFSKTGTGDAEVNEDEGLTGLVPGSGLPKSVRLKHTGGADVVLKDTLTPAAASMFGGAVHLMQVWYMIRGTGSITAGDITFSLTEINGLGDVQTISETPRVEKDRWHFVEVLVFQTDGDSTQLRTEVKLENLSAEDIDVYVDAWRVGPGRLPRMFAGRVMRVQGKDAHEGLFHAKGYEVQMVDWAWDFNRLLVDGDGTAANTSAQTTLQAIIPANTRSQDAFTTNNVYAELGGHDAIDHEDKETTLGSVVNRVMEQAAGYWYIDFFRDVHAIPVGYEAAPIPINDVVDTPWLALADVEDGADIVTEGTVPGDQSKSNRPSATFTDSAAASRYGTRETRLDADADIKSAAQAVDVAEYYRTLLGDRQREMGVAVYDEPRLRPGMVMPIQIENRGWDTPATIESVQYAPGTDGAFIVASIKIGLAKEDFLDLILRAREDAANQKGKRQYPDDVHDAEFWGA